jgi:SpoVK/Ycf46/Vps4 family AAA+-type ATPase
LTASPAPIAGSGKGESLAHLLGRIELVMARVRAAVEWRRATDPDPLDRFKGLHISAAQVERLLSPQAALPVDPASGAELERLEREADEAQQRGTDLRLRRLKGTFGLDELDIELLLIGLAPDLDSRFERLYGYLHDDVSRRRASIGLWLELCGLEPASGVAWNRLSVDGNLVAGRLVLVEDPERPFLTRSLRLPDRVTAFLLGDDTLDPQVAALAYSCDGLPGDEIQPLERWLGGNPTLAYVRESPGATAAPVAVEAAKKVGRDALTIDLRRIRPEDDPSVLAALVAREARLSGRVVVAGPIEALQPRGVAAIQAFAELSATVILSGSGNWDPVWSREVPLLCEAHPPSGERAHLWDLGSDGDVLGSLHAAEATSHFRLSPEQIQRAARSARLQAHAAERPVRVEDLRAGARAQNAAGLERLARRIEPAVGFADLVLADDVLEQLRELTVRARQRERVLGEWQMAGAASRRRGLTALFAGASGTGKTMAAEVVAGEMGLDLYVVDLASVVDKYVGETEKNLDRIFNEAESVNGVLLFDEADALFGKRSEVAEAHDRYANVEIAYLLQRMEMFEGIAILATNLRSNLDEAFARRLDTLIDFPEPEEADRLRLWDRCLGTSAPRGDDIDLGFLARAFKLSGGNIRNIAVAAAYFASERETPISMAALIRATQREYRKLGHMVVESEFGEYYPMLSASAPGAPPGISNGAPSITTPSPESREQAPH